MRILIHHPHDGLKKKGTNSHSVFQLQHMFTTENDAMTVIHTKFMQLEQKKTKEIRVINQYTVPPPEKELKIIPETEKFDLLEQYKQLLFSKLTFEPQLLSVFGQAVHEACLTEFDESGKEMRAKLWPENKKIKMIKVCRNLFAERVIIHENGGFSTIALRPN